VAVIISSPMSDSGKSFFVSTLSNILRGIPFKAQNMSLNSFPSDEGGEIAFIQAFQAIGSGLSPKSFMNPVLLKPSGKSVEVIVFGNSLGNFSPGEYYSIIKKLWSKIKNIITDNMIIEAAGGLGEPNFLNRDISGFLIMKELKIPTILILDIDRGGAFASAFGIYKMFPTSVRGLLKGFIINKFRGEEKYLEKAIAWLENKTKMKYLGYVPYLEENPIMPEDSMNIKDIGDGEKKVSIIAYPYMSNFNEFYALYKSNSNVKFVYKPSQLKNSDLVILPGTKNTYKSILWLKERNFIDEIRKYPILGICGGFQLMGKKLVDPYGLEAENITEYPGLNIFDIKTIFDKNKVVSLSEGKGDVRIEGYEIRRGKIHYENERPLFYITKRNKVSVEIPDGAKKDDKMGLSLHGSLFSSFSRELEDYGIKIFSGSMKEEIENMVQKNVKIIKENIDVDRIDDIYNSKM